jgi:hypothetical protein
MRTLAIRRWDRETLSVLQITTCLSFLSFLFYLRHGDLLLYGDAVAHINIARRVFDSSTPGLLQLGTVWLPLPHLLMIPFLFSNWMWQTGVGGAIPSMIAYVLGAVGIFRLVRNGLSFLSAAEGSGRVAAWFAAGIYALNPNLMYLQSTAMTEPLYLALFIWTVVHLSEFVKDASIADEPTQRSAASSLVKSGLCLAAACLTRYDGWFLTAVACVSVLPLWAKARRDQQALSSGFKKFALLAVLSPALWIGYNAAVYRNPLEFVNGPYSAKAIAQKSSAGSAHPGSDDLIVAFSFFLKAAEMNVAPGLWQKLWVILLLAGSVVTAIFAWRRWTLLLLCAPLPFYVLSIAYSGVPVYVPSWWPFSYYNLRYGLELLPAFAVFVPLAPCFCLGLVSHRTGKAIGVLATAIFVAGSYAALWHADPICFQEAWINSRTRIALETELAANLKKLPRDSRLLMYLGDHVGAVQRAGIPLRRVVNEGNHRPWKTPSDRDGLWERALADPGRYVDYVVAAENDLVARDLRAVPLVPMVVIHVLGQPPVTIFWTHGTKQP